MANSRACYHRAPVIHQPPPSLGPDGRGEDGGADVRAYVFSHGNPPRTREEHDDDSCSWNGCRRTRNSDAQRDVRERGGGGERERERDNGRGCAVARGGNRDSII